MSEIDAATIARAILHEEYDCAPEDVPNLYGKALATARLVMALVLPAIERARVEERERCLKIVDAQTPDWVKERSGPYWDGYREAMEDASDDIRKG